MRIERRLAVLVGTLYALAIVATLIAGSTIAFLIVIVVGGPITGYAWWASSCQDGGRNRNRNRQRARR